jgi:uracil-DNA glycosylase
MNLQKIDESWNDILFQHAQKEKLKLLQDFLDVEKTKHIIYPSSDKILEAFRFTTFHNLKVVILGQDPYHGDGQAHGLSFSVPPNVKLPPSLKNIFKEIENDLNVKMAKNGYLECWAKQGVLLLNATLTVRKGEPGSHQNKGWEAFTDEVINQISKQKKHVVFMLWGNFAQQKRGLIDEHKHLVLSAAHPSPFSAHRGFFGCKHFSKTNEWLQRIGEKEIDWKI